MNISVPDFTLEGPAKGVYLTNTNGNRFDFYLKTMTLPNGALYSTTWSIVPAIPA